MWCYNLEKIHSQSPQLLKLGTILYYVPDICILVGTCSTTCWVLSHYKTVRDQRGQIETILGPILSILISLQCLQEFANVFSRLLLSAVQSLPIWLRSPKFRISGWRVGIPLHAACTSDWGVLCKEYWATKELCFKKGVYDYKAVF